MTPPSRTNLEGLESLRTSLRYVFLDDGGVLSDSRLRPPEWLRLIGEFMPPRLGSTAEQWRDANREFFGPIWSKLLERLPEFSNYREFHRAHATNWVSGMCSRVGVSPPSDDEAVALYTELSIYISGRAQVATDGASDVVFALHRAGYTLYTASGTPSWELRGIVAKMGIAHLLSGLYGPDLVDHVQYGAAFYRGIFEHAGVTASQALVVESDSECCQWAVEAGANAIWIDSAGRGDATTLSTVGTALVD